MKKAKKYINKVSEYIDKVSESDETSTLTFAIDPVIHLDIPTVDERRRQVEKNTKTLREEYYQTMLNRIHSEINIAFTDASYFTKHYIKISASIIYPNAHHLASSVIPRVKETIESELAALGYTNCETDYDPNTGKVSFIIKY